MHSILELRLDLSRVRSLVRDAETKAGGPPTERSNVYSPVKDERFVDESLRQSAYRLYKDETLFDAIEADVLLKLNEAAKSRTFSLARNDATHIVYNQGGFFSKHADFLSFSSNVVEEFTLILSLRDASSVPVQGGETLLHVNANFTHKSAFTTEPDSLLAFRKDIPHEGLPIMAGRKEILTLNLLATRNESEQVVVVSFPLERVALPVSANAKDYWPTTTTDASFVIPSANIKDFPESFFAGLLDFGKVTQPDNKARIVDYECTSCSREAFRVVHKALLGEVLTLDEVSQHATALDFFGIPPQAILAEAAAEPIPPQIKPTRFDASDDVIVCDTPEHTRVLAAHIVRDGWVPFRIIFCEGDAFFAGGLTGKDSTRIPLQPVFASIGSFDNIVLIRNVMTTNDFEATDITRDSFDKLSIVTWLLPEGEGEWDHALDHPGMRIVLEDDARCDKRKKADAGEEGEKAEAPLVFDEKGRLLIKAGEASGINTLAPHGLLGLEGGFKKSEVIAMVTKSRFSFDEAVVLPGVDAVLDASRMVGETCVLDAENRVAFTRDQALRAESKFIELDVCGCAQRVLNQVGWRLPQERYLLNHNFCNEQVYGRTNMVEVTGVFRVGVDC